MYDGITQNYDVAVPALVSFCRQFPLYCNQDITNRIDPLWNCTQTSWNYCGHVFFSIDSKRLKAARTRLTKVQMKIPGRNAPPRMMETPLSPSLALVVSVIRPAISILLVVLVVGGGGRGGVILLFFIR